MSDIFNIKKMVEHKKIFIFLALMLVIGFILVMLSEIPISENHNNQSNHTEQPNIVNPAQNAQLNDNMEVKLENILSSIEDVGNVEILINYKTTNEKLVLKENEGSQNEKIVIVDDGTNSAPFIRQERSGEIEGVIIVADGGDKINVRVDISEAVSALLNLPVHKIKVLKKEG